MATDLEARKTTSKSEAFLERKFAELCAHVRRIDLVGCLLTLPLTVLCYALAMGLFDRFVGANDNWVHVVRWAAYVGFVGTFLYLSLRAIRCAFRSVNPYYVAHQLEGTLPEAKNSLINWLDLHDEDLPAAFRKNLSTNAAEQLKESDLDEPLPTRRNRIMLGSLAVPALGLAILLIFGPAAFASSMLRAFLPFLDTDSPRTQITLVNPKGDIDVNAGQSVTFNVKIAGRIPASTRPDAPKLLYRYQPSEDFLVQPLSAEGGGDFTAQLLSAQVRTGFSYKITAGDAATDEHQVRVRSRAHVEKFEINYVYRPYRKLPKKTVAFPNKNAAAPLIHGQRGTDVEMLIRASRPVQQARVEIVPGKDLPTRLSEDRLGFVCRMTLEQSAQFRVTFTSVDGEENIDRTPYPIEVVDDEAPRVVLTQPDKNVSLPANGTLELEGQASDDVGIKSLALHFRVPKYPAMKLEPKAYRAGKSLLYSDGSYPDVIAYQDFVALDQLKEKETIRLLQAGDVLEYWLEATDNSDYPNPAGNVGKSLVYQVTLLANIADAQQQAQRQRAKDAQAKHDKKQDDQHAKDNKTQKKDGGSGDGGSDQQSEKKNNETKEKIKTTLDQKDKKGGGGPGEKKPGPQDSGDGPQPKSKDQKTMPPDDGGNNKEPGTEPGVKSEARDGGMEVPDPAERGGSKDGPKQTSEPAKDGGPMAEPAGGAKDGGPMGRNAPPMGEPKLDGPMNGPMPTSKSDGSGQPGNAKADVPKKDGGPNLEDVAKLLDKLAQGDGKEKDAAAGELADIGKNSNDEPTRELAKEILDKNGRDPGTGKEKKKGKNPFGTGGKSEGISDDVKAAAANREFARRIGQMQLDDWKKRLTPELLKKAGVSEAEWLRYVRSQQSYDALVRQLNAKQTMAAVRDANKSRPVAATGPRLIEAPSSNDSVESGRYQWPPELRDAQFRLSKTKQ